MLPVVTANTKGNTHHPKKALTKRTVLPHRGYSVNIADVRHLPRVLKPPRCGQTSDGKYTMGDVIWNGQPEIP